MMRFLKATGWILLTVASTLVAGQTLPAQTAGNGNIDAPSQVWANARTARTATTADSGSQSSADRSSTLAVTHLTLPADAKYVPLTSREKFGIFWRSTYSPYTFLTAAFDAGWAEATGDGRQYGWGPEGFGKRYGAALADSESGIFFGRFLFPVLYKQDPRYFRKGKGSVLHRFFYATSRVVITRNDEGKDAANMSNVLGTLSASTLSNAYYPADKRGVVRTFVRTGNGLASEAETDLFREFWPDIRDKFLPRRVQQMRSIQRIGQ
jgi:hypothetical protein